MTGYLTHVFGSRVLPLQVLQSAAGFYIGTSDLGPYSHESEEYFSCEEAAVAALASDNWTQRRAP